MRLLLDTNVVLRHFAGIGSLSSTGVKVLTGADQISVSAVSFAEIGVKQSLDKLQPIPHLLETILDLGVRVLPLGPSHGLKVAELPLHHRDPFDRLLIAQAIVDKFTILTADRRFSMYDVDVVVDE